MKKLLLLVMAVVLIGCGKSKQLTELELKLDDAVGRINVLEEANRPTPHRVDPTTGLPIGDGAARHQPVDPTTGLPTGHGGAAHRQPVDPTTGLPIIGGGLLPGGVQPKK